MRGSDQMKVLDGLIEKAERELLKLERDAADKKLEVQTLKNTRAALKGESVDTKGRAQRGKVKETVLKLLATVGQNGLNAVIAVQMAKDEMGVDLERGSVSSLLSRLAGDDTLHYDGKMYRLAEFRPPAQSEREVNVHPIRSSGGSL